MPATIASRDICKHCGIPLPRAGKWCQVCVSLARNNRAVCSFCGKDITEFANCWAVERELEYAQTAVQFDTRSCPSCWEYNHENVHMRVKYVNNAPSRRLLHLECPVCYSTAQLTIVIFLPPPKGM